MIRIDFEGPDGTGKSTVRDKVFDKLILDGFTEQTLRKAKEPQGIFREIILDPDNKYKINDLARLFLYQADRAIASEFYIRNKQGKGIVLSDRGPISTCVYQPISAKIPIEDCITLSDIANHGLWPDVVFIFDCDYETSLKRREGRSKDYFDAKGEEFYNKLREGYKNVEHNIAKHKFVQTKFIYIEASRPLENIVEKVYDLITKIIKL